MCSYRLTCLSHMDWFAGIFKLYCIFGFKLNHTEKMIIVRLFIGNGNRVPAFKEFSGELGLFLNADTHFDRYY